MVGGVGQREQRRLGVYSNIARRSVSYTAVSTHSKLTLWGLGFGRLNP